MVYRDCLVWCAESRQFGKQRFRGVPFVAFRSLRIRLQGSGMHEGEVYFRLAGDNFNPHVVTERIGISPNRYRSNRQVLRKKSQLRSWELSSGKITSEFIDVYDLSAQLTSILVPHAAVIRSIIQEHSLFAVLQVVLDISLDLFRNRSERRQFEFRRSAETGVFREVHEDFEHRRNSKCRA